MRPLVVCSLVSVPAVPVYSNKAPRLLLASVYGLGTVREGFGLLIQLSGAFSLANHL
jgi:hypothetical protein